jgi:hypothetical protein
MWAAGWSGVDNSFKKAERNFIKTGKLLQLYEINPTLSRFAIGNEGLWLVEGRPCATWPE